MPKARNAKERANQILGWLKDEWPAGRPVRVRWVKEIKYRDEGGKVHQCYGEAWRDGRRWVIDLSKRTCRRWSDVAETLIHEYCHVKVWGPATLEFHSRVAEHPTEFIHLEAEMIARWRYDGGAEISAEYPVG